MQAAAASAVSPTFDEVLNAVPLLKTACCTALGGVPGSGLKLLRRVSKLSASSMLDAVHGYILELDGKGATLMQEMSVLEYTRLSHLRVVLKANRLGG